MRINPGGWLLLLAKTKDHYDNLFATYPVVTLQCDSLRVEDEVEEKQDSEDRIISRQNCEGAVLAIIGHNHPATKDGQSGHGV